MEFSGEPSAKLYKDGKIRFNNVAGKLWFQDCEHVEIYVDESGSDLGFKPAAETTEGTYSYGRDGEYGGHISVRSVLAYYGIWHEKVDESIALPVRYDADENMVVVDLQEALERWGRPSLKDAT
jgi:hypothetical protein